MTPPYEFTTDTLVSLLEEIAKRDHGGHFTIFKFTTNWKCVLGTPPMDWDWVYGNVFGDDGELDWSHGKLSGIDGSPSLSASINDCIDRLKREAIESNLSALAESPIESRLMRAMLPYLWASSLKAQHRIGPYRVDLALLDHRIAIECDGHAYHSTKHQRTHDAKRDRYLTAQGWRVVRCTGTEIHNDVAKVVADIEAVVNSSPSL